MRKVLRLNALRRRAAALGTDIYHVVQLDAALTKNGFHSPRARVILRPDTPAFGTAAARAMSQGSQGAATIIRKPLA